MTKIYLIKILHCNVSNRVQDLRVTQWPPFFFFDIFTTTRIFCKVTTISVTQCSPQQLLIVVGSSYCCVVCEKIDCSKMKSLSTFLYCHKRTIFKSVAILFMLTAQLYNQKLYFHSKASLWLIQLKFVLKAYLEDKYIYFQRHE